MQQPTAALIHEGDQTAKAIGPVIIRISRTAQTYVLTTEYASTGQLIAALGKSYPTESGARNGANGLYFRFADGLTVEQVIKAVATVPPAPIAAPSKPLMSDAQYNCLSIVEAAGTSVVRFAHCSISTLYAMEKRGWVSNIEYTVVETRNRAGRPKLTRTVKSATMTDRGARVLDQERTRRAAARLLNEQIERATGVTR